MGTKPRNFDKNIEKQLVLQGICTQAVLDKYTDKEKRYFFNQYFIGTIGRLKHPDNEHAFSLYSSVRRKHIPRASRFEEMKADIPLLKQVTNHWADNWADGYIITQEGYDLFSNCCNAVVKASGLVDSNNRPYNPPRNGIRSRLKDGKKCHIKDVVPNEVYINKFSLLRLMGHLTQQGNYEHMASQIKWLITTAKASKSGFLPTTYIQSNGGRLYAEGALNLQNCSRIIRTAGLVDHYDIDIENCHYTLLAQMCGRINVPTPCIDHYIRNKKAVRTEIATLFKCSEDMAKEILIALIYGSNLTSYGVLSKLNLKRDEIDIKGSWIDKLAKEITRVTKSVVAYYTDKTPGHFKIRNDAGMMKKTKCENEKCVAKSKLLAHILHGAESFILQHMISYLGGNVVLLQHDGVTCKEPVDTDALSEHIAKMTGYRVQFDIEKLTLDLSRDDIDTFEPVNHEEVFGLYAA